MYQNSVLPVVEKKTDIVLLTVLSKNNIFYTFF